MLLMISYFFAQALVKWTSLRGYQEHIMASHYEKNYPVKVSIVLPTFNQSKFLLNAVQTIFNQTYENFELIIVNDGSTDETAAFLAAINHPKLRVITQQNQGLPSALNNGFAVAHGEYWTWTSTDNSVSPAWLEELVNALENSPPDVAYAFSHYAVIDESGKMLYVNRDQRFDIPTLLMRHSGNASFLYRSELARKVGPYDTSFSHAVDLDMWVRMAGQTRAILVESVLYYYRQHANSMTTDQNKVREATKEVVNKFLAKSGGKFNIDELFPSISLSANPALERWKARIRLASLGLNATFYCPVDAIVDQLIIALSEKYDRGLIGNIVLLYVKEGRWDAAVHVIAMCRQADSSDFLTQLADIISRKALDELQKIPFLTLDEKSLASDCQGSWSQQQLLRNLFFKISVPEDNQLSSFENLVTSWINQLEDQKDHPEIWQSLAAYQPLTKEYTLNQLRQYLSELTSIPQDPKALLLLKILEAMCLAYSSSVKAAKISLKNLNKQYPNLPVLMGALLHLYHHEEILSP